MSRRSSTGSSPGGPGARLLHLDLFSGIAGNMFLGALLDLGLPRKELEADLAGLGVEFTLRVRKVTLGGLAARRVRVGAPRSAPSGKRGRSPRSRSYREIVALLRKARLEARVRERALAIFEALGRAEARVHGIALERVHFHEVGALDAIVDVTAAAVGLSRLGIERVSASPVALGEGSVQTQHGVLPLPAPATLELLRGVPTLPAHVGWETVTPTGAAILRTLAEAYGPLPAMTIEAVGHAGRARCRTCCAPCSAVARRLGRTAWSCSRRTSTTSCPSTSTT